MERHTTVMHYYPDFEALFMDWLLARHEPMRRALGFCNSWQRKYILAGDLHATDWPGLPLGARELEQNGFLFLDCGGEGARFDQHSAEENRGGFTDRVCSLDLLVRETRVLERDPAFAPFVSLISESDRRGLSCCPKSVFDRTSKTPHVSRDIRTMIKALNELYPNDPERVRNIFFWAMDGLFYLWGKLVGDTFDGTGKAPNEAAVDLRECYFLTVDLAALGIEKMVMSDMSRSVEANELLAMARAGWFWHEVENAWLKQEDAWSKGKEDIRDFGRRRQCPYLGSDGKYSAITLLTCRSDSRYVPVRARRMQVDVVIQYYSDGRFLITRRGDDILFDRVADYLRRADARKRGGELVLQRAGKVVESDDASTRNTTSYVKVGGKRLPQFYFTSGGFAFGNKYDSNQNGLLPSALTPEEVEKNVSDALAGRPFCGLSTGRTLPVCRP